MATAGSGASGGDAPGGARERPPGRRPSAAAGESAGTGEEFRRGIEETLRRYTGQRCEEAGGLDGAFRARLAADVARFTLHGGKRMRAAFLWWGWRAAGGRPGDGDEAVALQLAGALELLQTCALVHDDLMDDSALRRGRPALHVDLARRHRHDGMLGSPEAYGASMATLAGDLALAWADDMFAEALPDGPAGQLLREPWRAMRTEMVAGQFLDLHTQAEGDFSAPAALRTACLKTALYTVERPLQLGASLRGAPPALVGALRCAGRRAGLAFQLRDDILGVFGDPRRTGKPAGDDVREGKNTYLVALAVARAEALGDAEALAVLRGSLGDRRLTSRRLARFRDVLTELGARSAVERRIERLSALALHRIHQVCDDPAVDRGLADLVRAAGSGPP